MVEEGGVVMVKSPELLTVPAEVVTESLPVVAPEGTTATSWVVVPELSVAVTPLVTVLEARVEGEVGAGDGHAVAHRAAGRGEGGDGGGGRCWVDSREGDGDLGGVRAGLVAGVEGGDGGVVGARGGHAEEAQVVVVTGPR